MVICMIKCEAAKGAEPKILVRKKIRKSEKINYFTPDVPLELSGNQKGMKRALFHKVM